MIVEILILFGLVLLQNASFTLVSRARNSSSLLYHAIAAVFSNGIWLLVIRRIILNPNNVPLMITYVIAAVIGSLGMHYLAMKFFEKKKPVHAPKPSIGRIVLYLNSDNKLYPAIITEVWSDTCVNLNVFLDTVGLVSVTSSVQGSGLRNWNWPVVK